MTLSLQVVAYLLLAVPPPLNAQDWSLTGNSGTNPNSNFLGTIDNQPLVFKANGVERLRVKENGNIGIGTPSPRTKLEINSDSLLPTSPTGAPSIFRVIGEVLRFSYPDKNIYYSIWIGDSLIPGVNPSNNVLEFNFKHTRSCDVQRVLALRGDGNVGIGTTSPEFKLDVAGPVHASSFPTSSDGRLKINITQLTNVLEKLDKIQAVSFEWNELYKSLGRSTRKREIGIIAQEVEAVFPELVTTWRDKNYRAIDYGRLAGVLVEAVNELKAEKDTQIAALKAKNATLQKQFRALEERLATLEQARVNGTSMQHVSSR